MLEVDEHGKSATWGEHVTDKEYRRAPYGREPEARRDP
jgi:hypothetical protein